VLKARLRHGSDVLCAASKAQIFFAFFSSSRKVNCMWPVATKYCWQSNIHKCVLTAEPRFVIPRQLDTISSTIRYSLISTVIQEMEKFVRCELACLSDAYLTIDLWTNRIMASFQAISVHFTNTNTKWKLRIFVVATDSFSDKHTPNNIAKSKRQCYWKDQINMKSNESCARQC